MDSGRSIVVYSIILGRMQQMLRLISASLHRACTVAGLSRMSSQPRGPSKVLYKPGRNVGPHHQCLTCQQVNYPALNWYPERTAKDGGTQQAPTKGQVLQELVSGGARHAVS
jgi:hypothetical protein